MKCCFLVKTADKVLNGSNKWSSDGGYSVKYDIDIINLSVIRNYLNVEGLNVRIGTSALVLPYFCSKPTVTVDVSVILFTLNLLRCFWIFYLFISWKEVTVISGEVLISIYVSVASTKESAYSREM